jgi:hypothetical protein
MSKEKKLTYHGWIVREPQGDGFKDKFHAEYMEANGERRTACYSTSPAEVIEWWDKRIGKQIKLLSTPLLAYRVFTEEV